MASWMVHLRIADELLRHLDNIDETSFVMGNIAPDSGVPSEDWTEYHPPKELTHFRWTETIYADLIKTYSKEYLRILS